MEEKKLIGEKPMRVLQCYYMFYGEVPTYKSQEQYSEIYIKTQAMMSFLDLFGYSLTYTSSNEPLKRWYCPSRHFSWGDIMISPEIDASINVFNQVLEGMDESDFKGYYQKGMENMAFYDEEITSRIGNLVKEYATTREEDVVDVLRKLTTPRNFRDRLEGQDYENHLQDLMEYAKSTFLPVINLTKEYSINDPRYLEFLKKYLRLPETNKEKRKEY